ncbi:hypothetical protein BDR26DRAFT_872885, partial [Obelidium mucronatum]
TFDSPSALKRRSSIKIKNANTANALSAYFHRKSTFIFPSISETSTIEVTSDAMKLQLLPPKSARKKPRNSLEPRDITILPKVLRRAKKLPNIPVNPIGIEETTSHERKSSIASDETLFELESTSISHENREKTEEAIRSITVIVPTRRDSIVSFETVVDEPEEIEEDRLTEARSMPDKFDSGAIAELSEVPNRTLFEKYCLVTDLTNNENRGIETPASLSRASVGEINKARLEQLKMMVDLKERMLVMRVRIYGLIDVQQRLLQRMRARNCKPNN